MGKISDLLLEELKKHEGVRTQVYDDLTSKPVASYADVQGAPTIAMGKKIQDHERDYFANFLVGKKKLEGNELNKVIKDSVVAREKKLAGVVKVPVTQSMFDSLFSFAFNTGFGSKFFKAVLDKLNAGDYVGAQQAIAQGPQSAGGKPLPGLVKRRAFEAELFAKEGLAPTSSVLPLAGANFGEMYEVNLADLDPRGKGVVRLDDKALWGLAAGTVVLGAGVGAAIGVGTSAVFGLDTKKTALALAGVGGAAAAVQNGLKVYRLYKYGKKV